MLPCVCSVIDHRWPQNVVKTKKVTHELQASVSQLFYHILASSVVLKNNNLKFILQQLELFLVYIISTYRKGRFLLSSDFECKCCGEITSLLNGKSNYNSPCFTFIFIHNHVQKMEWGDNRLFYSCELSILAFEWTWGWGWPCFDTNLFPVFLWKLCLKNTS